LGLPDGLRHAKRNGSFLKLFRSISSLRALPFERALFISLDLNSSPLIIKSGLRILPKSIIVGIVLLAALTIFAGCGGGSGGAGTHPSLCVDSVAVRPAFASNVQIPESTYPAVGRAHTNHLILKSGGRAVGFAGFTPDQIRTAYGIPSNGGSGVITVIEGFDNPNAQIDFNFFSTTFGLPQETSTDITADTNAHLQIVYVGGAKPHYNADWSQESALDIQWIHAMAPNAKIVLIEAPSGNPSDLMAGDDLAATIPGAHECSNSWSEPESAAEPTYESHFIHPGMVYYFASGDTGGARDYPPASPNVVSVAGTSLTLDGSNHRVSETTWTGSGCGKSNCLPRPTFQDELSVLIGPSRGIADVSAVGDPNTGVRVRWQGKWLVFGGTSSSCPIIAGIANVAGTNRDSSKAENTFIYSRRRTSDFFDVTTGTAGIFHATTGWDFPTGVGVPNGAGGF
jgi:subtilase family serine protease